MKTNWNNDLAKGKKGEAKVKNYLERTGWEVIDVSLDKEYQGKDTDFLAKINGRQTTIEVKTDDCISITGNVCLEEIQSIERNTPGWIHYCEAEYIWFVCGEEAKVVRREDIMEYYEKCRKYMAECASTVGFDFGNPPMIIKDLNRDYVITSKNIPDGDHRTGKIWLINWEVFSKYYTTQVVNMEV